MKTNIKTPSLRTFEGATAKHISLEQQLRRSVMACMLWESGFYESGTDIATRIVGLVKQLPAETISQIALEARLVHNLRHAPLLVCAAMAKYHKGNLVGFTVAEVVSRADELAEVVSLVCTINGKPPTEAKKCLSTQIKKGLAKAFQKFNGYQLAKYNRDGAIKLRDVLFLSHAKPKDEQQAATWKMLVEGNLPAPDTWEVALSTGKDKKETFERLITEGKLGYLALLRNLRNMVDAGVDLNLMKAAILDRKGADRVLPFRFVAAARHAPRLEKTLDAAMLATLKEMPNLSGSTLVLVDVSISMDEKLSGKSDLTRLDAAATLASMIDGDVRVFTFSNPDRMGKVVNEAPHRLGMAGVDAIRNNQDRSGTMLGQAIQEMNAIPADRLIVITDEQSRDRVPDPIHQHAYMINVASNQNGVGYGKWTHIDGFSESVLRFIMQSENVS